MARVHFAAVFPLALALFACGGGSGGGQAPGTPPATGGACSTGNQKQFVLDVARDWYLFPELLPAAPNTASYATAQELLDALTAIARAQGRDRYFSYLTTPQADISFLQEGQFIGFGFRTFISSQRLFATDVFENSPAAGAGMTRGAEVTAIDSGSGYVATATVLSNDPTLSQAFGPATEGIERGLRFRLASGQAIEARLVKRIVTIAPVPASGGTAILTLPGNPSVEIGYVHLRTFISTADAPLRNAFAQFRARGIQYFIFDVRYNGGGLVSIADLVGDLFGRSRSTADVYSGTRFNAAKAANDTIRRFSPQSQSVSPVRIAFITTGSSASASELVANSMKPWAEVAIVGQNTYGKPVGQSAFDLPGCDLRLRLVSFKTTNTLNEGDYYTGLASTVPFACAATDDLQRGFGDGMEGSTAAALQWIQSGACGQLMASTAPGAQKPGFEAGWTGEPPASAAQAYLPGLQ